jgi:hypothetical protein
VSATLRHAALEAFVNEMGLAADEPVDLVVSGFFTSQARGGYPTNFFPKHSGALCCSGV